MQNNYLQRSTGRFYEDFNVGDVYDHALGRTVTETDNRWFTMLTQNTNPVHFDEVYALQTPFQRPLVNSAFTIALVTGLSVSDISQNVMANLGWDDVKLPNPVFEGDTIYAYSELIKKCELKSRKNVGIIVVRTVGYNQRAEVVISYLRTMMVYKREAAPIKDNQLLQQVWQQCKEEQ